MTARVGDLCIGTCRHKDHDDPLPITGTVAVGSTDDFTDGIGSARTGDIVISDCGHIGVIIGSAPSVKVDSLAAAKPGSYFTGDYTGVIVSGSPDTILE